MGLQLGLVTLSYLRSFSDWDPSVYVPQTALQLILNFTVVRAVVSLMAIPLAT